MLGANTVSTACDAAPCSKARGRLLNDQAVDTRHPATAGLVYVVSRAYLSQNFARNATLKLRGSP